MNDEDKERWKNLLLFKMYATDKEVAESMPWIFGILALIVIVFVIVMAFQ